MCRCTGHSREHENLPETCDAMSQRYTSPATRRQCVYYATHPLTCAPAFGCCCLQYLAVALLLRALQRSRTPVLLQLPSRREMGALLDTFGLLTVFYFCKNLSYLMIQASEGPPMGA